MLNCFGRYLTLWVALSMVCGAAIGATHPEVAQFLGKATVAQVSLPVGILIWLMIYPMTLKVDFEALKNVAKHPRGILITTVINWGVKPFTMFGFTLLFFRVFYSSILNPEERDQYTAGSVILGGAPCTAMVFVWSQLSQGDPAYTLVQVAINDLLILILYVPTLYLFLNVSSISIPWLTVILSVVIFVAVPFLLGFVTRKLLKQETLNAIEKTFEPIT